MKILRYLVVSIILTGCGGGSETTNPTTFNYSGRVIDGPVVNASVSINGANCQDSTTDEEGRFTISCTEEPIVSSLVISSGGIDSITGLEIDELTSPLETLKVITPATTINAIDFIAVNEDPYDKENPNHKILEAINLLSVLSLRTGEEIPTSEMFYRFIAAPNQLKNDLLYEFDESSSEIIIGEETFQLTPLVSKIANTILTLNTIENSAEIEQEIIIKELLYKIQMDDVIGIDSVNESLLSISDFDDDGVNDDEDLFPFDAAEWLDTDTDGIGNNADTDDDGDGIADAEDLFPFDAAEWLDTDTDGIGNNADTDDDGDGVNDAEDYEPLDPNEAYKPIKFELETNKLSVPENETFIHTFKINFEYSMTQSFSVDGDDKTLFKIDSKGNLMFKDALDYESLNKTTFSILINYESIFGEASKSVNISVSNISEGKFDDCTFDECKFK